VTAELPASRTEPDGAPVVRVLSYNIRSMRDDRRALARVIKACAPDVVCIQEAPRFFRWRKHASWLARESGLVRVTGGATACGPMILSSLRAHVEHTEDILLPRTPGLHQRGFATAVLRIGSARLSVISAHLSINADERYEQTGLLLDQVAAASYGAHTVVGGDFNDTPEGRSFRRIAAELQDCWAVRPWGAEFTSNPREPVQRIDAIFVGKEIEVLGCGVPIGLPDERRTRAGGAAGRDSDREARLRHDRSSAESGSGRRSEQRGDERRTRAGGVAGRDSDREARLRHDRSSAEPGSGRRSEQSVVIGGRDLRAATDHLPVLAALRVPAGT